MESDASYLSELLAEKDSLDPSFVHSMRCLTAEINRIQGGGKQAGSPNPNQEEGATNGTQSDTKEHEGGILAKPPGEGLPKRQPRPFKKPIDPFDGKLYQPIKLSEKVFIPTKDYPKFNFVGKLLGPRGNTFKRLQQNTGTKMSILGRGSMRDREKEEEMRGSGEEKYTHLSEDLHVLIEVEAPPGQAHARLGIAIEEIKKFLVPEINDDIHQEQMREMAILNCGPDDLVQAQAPAPVPMQGPFVRGRARGRGVMPVGRPTAVGRGVMPGGVRTHRLQPQRAHLQVAFSAARSAAGLPRSPTVAHAAPRTASPQVGDPYAHGFETYEGMEYEAAYPEPAEPVYYAEYGQPGEGEAYETSYPAPARIVSAAASYKSAPNRPMKKSFREASQPY